MKLFTHSRTPKPEISKTIIAFLVISIALICFMFGCVSFTFFSTNDYIAGTLVAIVPFTMLTFVYIIMRDIDKAYIEIDENMVHTVDYYFGKKRERYFQISEITSKEIIFAFSPSFKIKGY